MSTPLTCPQGHRWEPPPDATLNGAGDQCPVCGRAAGLPDPEATLFAAPSIPLDPFATLPGIDEEASPATVDAPLELPDVAGYELIEELGRGGMGIVFKARQRGLNRIVALKMLLGGNLASANNMARFRAEAEAIARLQHPNIVQVYEVGEQSGRPYFSLEYVDGGSLAKRLTGDPLPARTAAELVEVLARAVHAAHQGGVIHRDLKPANILLVSGGVVSGEWSSSTTHHSPLTTHQPKITDFGLAKQLQSDSNLSQSNGGVVGTPSYMAPEQAGGKASTVGPTADVYSLGAILYELLTGRAPFRGETPLDTMLQVLSEDPVPPSRLHPRLPRDVETICLKCLDKDPRRRYPSAVELADELRRFLSHEPIRARPISWLARGVRWCRRNPALAAVSGLAAGAMVAVVALSVSFGIEQTRLAGELEIKEKQTREALEKETKQRLQLEEIDRQRRENEKQRKRFERLSATLALDQGLTLCAKGEVNRGLLWLVRSLEIAPADATELQYVIRANIAQWRQQLHAMKDVLAHAGGVTSVAFSNDGKVILTGSKDRTARLWDAATGRPLGPVLKHGAAVSSVGFSPDGATLLTGSWDKSARLWDARTGTPIGAPLMHTDVVTAVAFSPFANKVVTAGYDGSAQVWDAGSGKKVGPPMKHEGFLTSVAFSPDGRTLLTGGMDKTARLWEVSSGKELKVLQHRENVMAVAFSPDGQYFATGCSDRTAQIFLAEGRTPFGQPLQHRERVAAVAFSPDNRTLVTGSWDKTARLWDVSTGKAIGPPLSHQSEVVAVAFSPDGQTVLTGSGDKAARLWEPALRPFSGPKLEHRDIVSAGAFSADGQMVATGGSDHKVHLWNATTGRERGTGLDHGDKVRVLALALSPDGGTLVSGTDANQALVWDAISGEQRKFVLKHKGSVTAVAFSPDGKHIVTASRDRTAQLWDAETGEPVGKPLLHKDWVTAITFSPDGQTLATACEDKHVRFWKVETQSEGIKLVHPAAVTSLAFSPDGKTLLTGCQDRLARFWDVAGGTVVGRPLPHGGSVECVAYARDARLVLTGSDEGAAQLWDAVTGKAVGPAVQHGDRVGAVAFSPDGETVLTVGGDKLGRLRRLPAPADDAIERLVVWVQLVTSMELDEGGTIQELDPAGWLRSRDRLLGPRTAEEAPRGSNGR